jgi:hypothetical protein
MLRVALDETLHGQEHLRAGRLGDRGCPAFFGLREGDGLPSTGKPGSTRSRLCFFLFVERLLPDASKRRVFRPSRMPLGLVDACHSIQEDGIPVCSDRAVARSVVCAPNLAFRDGFAAQAAREVVHGSM